MECNIPFCLPLKALKQMYNLHHLVKKVGIKMIPTRSHTNMALQMLEIS